MTNVLKPTSVKSKIVSVSEKLFTEKGVKTTSLANIANAAEISKGTLYYHYRSKDEIIFDIAEIHMSKIVSEIVYLVHNIPPNTTSQDMLLSVFQKIIGAKTRNTLHLHLLSTVIISNDKLKEKMLTKYKEWINEVMVGIKSFCKDYDDDHIVLSQMIVAILDGYLIQNIIGINSQYLSKTSGILSSIIE
jgi:AcrR family transcriptional regulator